MKKGVIYSLIAGGVVVLGLIGVYIFGAVFSDSSTGENVFGVNKESYSKNKPIKKQKTKIFLTVLDGSDLIKTTRGKTFGCNDKLLPVVVGENLTPQETLNKLLTYIDENNQLYNVFANMETPLQGKIVEGGNKVKRIELSGEGLGGGACDSPRIIAQLEKTMKQFPGFESMEIFFNGEPISHYLSERDDENLTLLPPEGDKIYFGAFPDFGGPEDYVTAKKIVDFNDLVGKNIKWAYFSNNWGRDGLKFPLEKVEAIASTGTIPFVRMMPRKILDTAYDKTFSLQRIIDGKFDDDLHQYARDVKNYGQMVLVDFGLEMNGNWFPWSGAVNGGGVKTKYGDPQKADGPERFVDAYRHIVDIFREEKVNNVTWFWHPDVYSDPDVDWNRQKNYYPGDDYVDWIGISAYGPQNPDEDYWDTFPEIMRDTQKNILEIPGIKTKPLVLLEFGVTDHHPLGRKDKWLAGAFEYILNPSSPLQFKAISPWHENWEEDDDLWATIRLDSSPRALATFKKYIANERFVGADTN